MPGCGVVCLKQTPEINPRQRDASGMKAAWSRPQSGLGSRQPGPKRMRRETPKRYKDILSPVSGLYVTRRLFFSVTSTPKIQKSDILSLSSNFANPLNQPGLSRSKCGRNSGNICAPENRACLLYTSPSPRDKRQSRMPSSA